MRLTGAVPASVAWTRLQESIAACQPVHHGAQRRADYATVVLNRPQPWQLRSPLLAQQAPFACRCTGA